jgi:hypothetical protein
LIDTLRDWGVKVVFGMPGDGINGIMAAVRTRKDADQALKFGESLAKGQPKPMKIATTVAENRLRELIWDMTACGRCAH